MALIGLRVRRPSGRPLIGIPWTLRKIRGERHGRHVAGALVDIDELRCRACLADRLYGRDEGMCHGDDGIAEAHARGHQREPHRIGAVPDPNAIAGAAVLGELLLEGLDFRAADEARGAQGPAQRVDQFLFEVAM